MEIIGVTESVVSYLRERIITGEMTPGEKINENKLSQSLSISRSPLREAMRLLETERLITTSPRKGSIVTPVSREDFAEVFQIREMIELYAIDLMEMKGIRELPDLQAILDEAVESGMPAPGAPLNERLAYLEHIGDYHVQLVISAGNKKLIQFYQTIYSNVKRYQFFFAYNSPQITPRTEKKDHRAILERINRGLYKEAQETLREHIAFYYARMKNNMKNTEAVRLDARKIRP